ncbi:TatD family hydrolase [Candidatus Giovannonibacteria bacterium]|nr:TatD family hydrolase [Candidatus Giovannonibacteria bacterium]
MRFFDVHTHVQFAAFREDFQDVISRALENNVWMVNVGTQKETSEDAIRLAHEYAEGVWATVGLHPIHTEVSHHDEQELGGGEAAKSFTSRGEDFDFDIYKKLASDPKVVAIGECGLDYYRLLDDSKKKQKEVFIKQIELAGEIKKPLMIHCREAFGDLIDIIKSEIVNLKFSSPGIIHFFSGSKDDAKILMDLGFSFSFGGVVTFAKNYEELVRYTPLDRILLETDAPYVAPVPYRGKRNEPAYVAEVAKKIAEIKGVSLEEVAEVTTGNAFRTFSL